MRIDRIGMIKFKKAGSFSLKTPIKRRKRLKKEASKQKRI